MDEMLVDRISSQVVKRFPEMRGVAPSVSRQPGSPEDHPRFVLTYKARAGLPGGRSISRVVRAVVDERGRLLRLSTSK